MTFNYVFRFKVQPVILREKKKEEKHHKFWFQAEKSIKSKASIVPGCQVFCGITHWSVSNIVFNIDAFDESSGDCKIDAFIDLHNPECGFAVSKDHTDQEVRKIIVEEFEERWEPFGFTMIDYNLGKDHVNFDAFKKNMVVK